MKTTLMIVLYGATMLLTGCTTSNIHSSKTVSQFSGPLEQTVNDLLRNVRTGLPKGWTASYDKQHSWLEISRDENVASISALPNGPLDEKPVKNKFVFAFRVTPAISAKEYHRLSAANAKIQREMNTLYENLIERRVPHKFDSFLPRTDSEKMAVAQYRALKESLHTLPDFYFKDIGLSLQHMPEIYVDDDRIRDECTQVQKRFLQLLSKYEDA